MAPSRGGTVEVGLSDLRERLEELRRWVEVLQTEGLWPGLEPDAPAAPPAPPAPVPFAPPPEDRPRDPTGTPAREPAPAVTEIDVGPLADLIELRRFEDELGALAGVRGVLVRRYGRGRARIAVGASPYALALELRRLEQPAEITQGAGGGLRVELGSFAGAEATAAVASSEGRQGGRIR